MVSNVDFVSDTKPWTLYDNLVAKLMATLAAPQVKQIVYPTSIHIAPDAIPGLNFVQTYQKQSGFSILVKTDDIGPQVLGHIEVVDGHCTTLLVGPSMEVLEALTWAIRAVIPHTKFEHLEDTSVYVGFWYRGEMGPRRFDRAIEIPSWWEIQDNYSAGTRADLNKLMAMTGPPSTGKVVLWHGPPGVGKTYAIRGMAKAWKNWCDFEYVIDPDSMFGNSAAYLIDVMMSGGKPQLRPITGINGGREEIPKQRWRLLVLEDAGELVAADAKSQTGQGLSRLLNMADGLIGQGVQLMVMITTNEPMERLNAAVSRAGRCFSNIEFEVLSAFEARAWQEANGQEMTAMGPTTLADLYNVKNPKPAKMKVGF